MGFVIRHRGRSVLLFLAAAGLLAVLVPFALEDAPPAPARPQVTTSGETRLQELRDFQDRSRPSAHSRLREAARRDPRLPEALLSVDEKFVQSLEGFSRAEKEQMWHEIKRAQEGVRRRNPDPDARSSR